MDQPIASRHVGADRLNRRHRKKSRAASRITNGSTFLPNVDGRSAWVRRAKDLISQHTSDLGGDSNLSCAEQALIRRCATLMVECERRETLFALATKVGDEQLAVYSTVVNTLRRTLEALGLRRRSRKVPTMDEFLRMRGHLVDGPADIDNDESMQDGDAG